MAKGKPRVEAALRPSGARGETGPARPHPVLGAVDVLLGALMLGGIWLALPARWWPVDVVGTSLALLLVVAGAGLLRRAPWAERVGTAAAMLLLLPGATVVSALAITAGNLAGLYGPVGMGAAVILAVTFLLFIPYFVVLPAAQLLFLRRPTSSSDDAR